MARPFAVGLAGCLAGFMGLAIACRDGPAPAPSAPAVVSALTTAEASLTRGALERGFLMHDPYAALAAQSTVIWQHGGLAVRPLTGTLVVVAEDLRLPLETRDLVLARSLVPGDGDGPMRWDEHFGLGPDSPRCALGAACDAAGRVMRWQEDGLVFDVTWEGAHPRAIAVAGKIFVTLSYGPAGLVELHAARIGATTPTSAWPSRVTYTCDADGRLTDVRNNAELTRYDYAADRLVGVTRGRTPTRIGYDDSGRVITLEGPGALTSRFTYAAPTAGLRADVTIASATDGVGSGTRFTWSATSEGTHEVRAGDGPRAKRWVFDAAGRLLTHESAGAQLRAAYDPTGRLVEVRHPDGVIQRLERTADGRLAAIVEGSRTLTFTLSARGDIATLGTSDKDRETWTWAAPDAAPDAAPALARIESGPAGHPSHVASFTRDPLGRLVRFTNEAGAVQDYRYDPASGLVVATRDERDAEIAYSYDDAGRLTQRRGPGDVSESWTWDGDGRLLTHVAPGGAPSTFAYDDDRLVRVTRADGTLAWTYDALGRVVSETTPSGTTHYTWSGPDLVLIRDAEGRSIKRELDAYGRLVRELASDGARRELTWADPRDGGQLLRDLVPGQGERRFSWDPLARLARLEETGQSPGATRDLHFSYRDDGRVELTDRVTATTWSYHRLAARPGAPAPLVLGSTSTATGAAEAYSYDPRGALSEKTSSVGDGFTLSYDPLGRPITITSAAAGTTRISWTPGGRIGAIDSDLGSRRYAYDDAGRPTTATSGASRWTLAYGDGSDPSELVDPAGRSTTFTWIDHRLATRTLPSGEAERFGYDDVGRLVSVARAGHVHAWRYDAAGRLAGHDIDGAPERSLTWDAEGRVVRDEGPGHQQSYAYDGRTRTSRDEASAVSTTRTRDAAGRTELLTLDGASHARYLRRNDGLLTRVEAASGFAVDLDHDAFGRRTGLRFAGGGTLQYKYDAARRLVGVEVGGSAGPTFTATFSYDAGGRVTSQTTQTPAASTAITMQYAYDDQQRLAAVTLPDGARRDYGWNPARDLVRIGAHDIVHDAAGRPVAGPAGTRSWDAAGPHDDARARAAGDARL